MTVLFALNAYTSGLVLPRIVVICNECVFRLRVAVPARGGACLHFSPEREQEPLGSRSRSGGRAEPVCGPLDCE